MLAGPVILKHLLEIQGQPKSDLDHKWILLWDEKQVVELVLASGSHRQDVLFEGLKRQNKSSYHLQKKCQRIL